MDKENAPWKMTLAGVLLVGLLLLAGHASPVLAGGPARPFPQHVSYAPGSLLPDHRTQVQLDDDVRAAYGRWKSQYVVQAGTEGDGHPRYRVRVGTGAGAQTVSEGQGYGMILAAVMAGHDPDARTLFDGLWEFFNDHRSTIDPRLMDWRVPADESPQPGADDSAFDGDGDIAFALFLAAEQWGSGGRIDYRAEALDVLAGVLASTIGPDSRLPMLGDWVDPDGSEYSQWTPRTSDFMPDHFRAFARLTGDPAWSAVLAASQQAVETLQTGYSPAAGLLPDFAVPESAGDTSPRPAPAGFLEGAHDGEYYYNAGRDPWRLAVDALLADDAVSRTQALRIATWLRTTTGGVVEEIAPGYRLDGTPIPPADYFTSFFAAPFGVAAMLDPDAQSWLNDVYDAVRDADEGYYEDSVALLSLLVMTGNYWAPGQTDTLFADGFESGDTTAWSGTVGKR